MVRFTLKNKHGLAVQLGTPARGRRRRREGFGEEVVGGRADFGDVVKVGVFREGATDARERTAATERRRGGGGGGGCGGGVGGWFQVGGGRGGGWWWFTVVGVAGRGGRWGGFD